MALKGRWSDWSSEDFVDPDAPSDPRVESDPWVVASVPGIDFGSYQRERTVDGMAVVDGGEQAHLDLIDDSYSKTFSDEPEWSDDIGSRITDEWDEPDPTVDPRSDLGEELYPPDNSVNDVSLELKIHDLLLLVASIDDEQKERCTALLTRLGVRKLRFVLPWLRTREWRGRTLSLFLEFRELWCRKDNARWWESWYWDQRLRVWNPTYQRSNLRLDVAYELMQLRSHCRPNEVIDATWFEDWDHHSVWKLGIPSFANFAVFRAGLATNGNWLDWLTRVDRRSRAECAECMDDTFAPFMLPSFADQYGLPCEVHGHGRTWLERLRHVREANEEQPNSLDEILFSFAEGADG